jgi:hypothetical protein
MSALPFDQTNYFVHLVLSQPVESARQDLYLDLASIDANEGQFYQGIIKHKAGLQLTTDQWFELLSRLPIRILRSDLDLRGLLSEEQISRLPPVTG